MKTNSQALSLAEAEVEVWRRFPRDRGTPDGAWSRSGRCVETGAKHAPYYSSLENRIDQLEQIAERAEKKKVFGVEYYLSSVLENRLIQMGENEVKELVAEFDYELLKRFKEIDRRGVHRKKYSVRAVEDPAGLLEGCLKIDAGKPARGVFSSDMPWEVFNYLTSEKSALEFLCGVHKSKVVKGESIREMVRKKYSGCRLTTYNGRFIFAELFHHVRSGMYREAEELVESNTVFFKEACRGFSDAFFLWLRDIGVGERDGRRGSWAAQEEKEDPFECFFLSVFSGSASGPRAVISTLEDFLWYHILLQRMRSSSFLGKITVLSNTPSKKELLEEVAAAVGKTKALLAGVLLEQWKESLQILKDAFTSEESLFISYSILKRAKSQSPGSFPVKRSDKRLEKDLAGSFIEIIQGVSSLFKTAKEKLVIICMASPFISDEWMEELAAEAIISSGDFSAVNDEAFRKTKLSPERIAEKVSFFFSCTGEIEKALEAAQVSGDKTTRIITQVLIEKIRKKDFSNLPSPSTSDKIVATLLNVLKAGKEKENVLQAIKNTGLLSEEVRENLGRIKEIIRLSPETKEFIPLSLLILAERLSDCPIEDARKLARSLLFIVGSLDIDSSKLQEIIRKASLVL